MRAYEFFDDRTSVIAATATALAPAQSPGFVARMTRFGRMAAEAMTKTIDRMARSPIARMAPRSRTEIEAMPEAARAEFFQRGAAIAEEIYSGSFRLAKAAGPGRTGSSAYNEAMTVASWRIERCVGDDPEMTRIVAGHIVAEIDSGTLAPELAVIGNELRDMLKRVSPNNDPLLSEARIAANREKPTESVDAWFKRHGAGTPAAPQYSSPRMR